MESRSISSILALAPGGGADEKGQTPNSPIELAMYDTNESRENEPAAAAMLLAGADPHLEDGYAKVDSSLLLTPYVCCLLTSALVVERPTPPPTRLALLPLGTQGERDEPSRVGARVTSPEGATVTHGPRRTRGRR